MKTTKLNLKNQLLLAAAGISCFGLAALANPPKASAVAQGYVNTRHVKAEALHNGVGPNWDIISNYWDTPQLANAGYKLLFSYTTSSHQTTVSMIVYDHYFIGY